MRFVLTALLMSWSVAVMADPLTYKGIKVGDPAQLVREKLPRYKLESANSYAYDVMDCVSGNSMDNSAMKACDETVSFAGATINTGNIRLKDGNVQSIQLSFASSWTNSVINAIRARYGAPKFEDTPIYKNGFGAKFSGRNLEWESDGSVLTLVSAEGQETTVSIVSSEERRAFAERAKSDAKRSSKDF